MEFLRLPSDAVLSVLRKLPLHDLLRVSASCRTLHGLANQPQLWQLLCAAWQQEVCLESWARAVPHPRDLYRVLYQLKPLVGLWAAVDLPPRGGLVCIVWVSTGCVVHHL